MKKIVLSFAACLIVLFSFGQTITQKLQKAFQQFEADPQLKHAISSLYVIDAKTGKVVFDKNSEVGLAGASTQKIITAATAFELLGKDYRYKTELGYDGQIEKDTLQGNIFIIGSADPTLGSWRYSSTKPDSVLDRFFQALLRKNIKWVKGSLYIDDRKFETQTIPNGWIWEDIGNYYGAGVGAINWRENQYDLFLKSGNAEGEKVRGVGRSLPRSMNDGDNFWELKTGKPGSGDNAYVYYFPRSTSIYYRGTIPPRQDSFRISASINSGAWYFYDEFYRKRHFESDGEVARSYQYFEGIQRFGGNKEIIKEKISNSLDQYTVTDISRYDPYTKSISILEQNYSPSLDSIIYWFLKKSINLYGEALVKTFAYEKDGFGSTEDGVKIVKDFWKQKGIDEDELNIYDGSGLSPLNRLTTHAQVEVLKYAKSKDWFPYFYDALPEYNGIKMKSGTISDVKGFCGYQHSADGHDYIFSFLVNNYNGPSSSLVGKMYKVLDLLK